MGGILRVGSSPHAHADVWWPLLRVRRGRAGVLSPRVAPPRTAGLACAVGLGPVSVITYTSLPMCRFWHVHL